MDSIQFINFILAIIGVAVFTGGTILLFVRSFRNAPHPRALRALGTLFIIWILYSICACLDSLGIDNITPADLLSVSTLNIGIFTAILTMLYPLELSRPGWITIRNILRLFIPFIATTAVYVIGLKLLGEPIRRLTDMDDLIAHLDEFNVWFRFFFYLTACFYVTQLCLCTSFTALQDQKLSNADTTPVDRGLIRWLRQYNLIIIILTAIYLATLLDNSNLVQFIDRFSLLLVGIFLIYRVGITRKPKLEIPGE